MTMLIRLSESGQPLGEPPILDSNFRALFDGALLPAILLPEHTEPLGWGIYDFTARPKLERYQKAVEGLPVKDDRGIWAQTWSVREADASEKALIDAGQCGMVRRQREQLLFSSDWTQIADAPFSEEKKAAWRAYRQELRDITKQSGFPWDVVWPTRPV